MAGLAAKTRPDAYRSSRNRVKTKRLILRAEPSSACSSIAAQPFDRFHRTAFKTKSAVQAVRGRNLVRLAFRDALLRTDRRAGAAANAVLGDAKALFFALCTAEGTALTTDWTLAEVEKFESALRDDEGFEDVTRLAWIDALHRGILLKDTVDHHLLLAVRKPFGASHKTYRLPPRRPRQ